ncbi:hypothetical protein Cgig2_015722 [Carnegiea gigantea]|uniref:Uncharacterized protein n=1 Tax=Carnegiea gigantea TaxID=171969 RepID=A0A9Q1Q531_9CARY|nr:hypothetical protein Cgig2_015722 [Carnegiea gigantea]
MVTFYKNFLGPQPCARTPVRGDILNLGSHLTMEQQVQLCKPFTKKDVQQAIFSIPNTKSPRPDGFSSGFFKQAWPQIKEIVCSVVMSFFKTSKADPPTLQLLMAALTEFHLYAGLKTNLHKSQMVFRGTNPDLQQHCLQSVGLRESSLPLQYLGVPIVASKLTKLECAQLVTKITAKSLTDLLKYVVTISGVGQRTSKDHLISSGNILVYQKAKVASPTTEGTIKALLKIKGDKYFKQINYVIYSAGIYSIWVARNPALFRNHHSTVQDILKAIKNQIIHRVLYLHTCTKKLNVYIDRILK